MFGFGKKKKFEPLTVENECGKFTMEYFDNDPDQPAYAYLGFVDWRDLPKEHELQAEVYCDTEGDFSAEKGFAKLSEILADDVKWDSRVKEYALKHALETWGRDDGRIEIWGSGGEDAEPITKEQFIGQLELSNITVYNDGSLDFIFPVDGMFTDHELLISINSEGKFDGGGLQG